MNTVSHTPTPWRPHQMESDAIVGPDGKAIALVMGRSRTEQEDAANLAFIVRACNSHAALVAELERMTKWQETRIAHLEAGEIPDNSAAAIGVLKIEVMAARAALKSANA